MQATSFTRYDCQVGKKRRTYEALLREWKCNDCEGRLVERWSAELDWHAECGRCGGTDFIHEYEMAKQRAEAIEVLDGLPAEIVAQLV